MELFLSTLTPKAAASFFRQHVIFWGDMPTAALGQRFCEMTKEFVSKFGGGLVIVSGPRFGPGQLAGTPPGRHAARRRRCRGETARRAALCTAIDVRRPGVDFIAIGGG